MNRKVATCAMFALLSISLVLITNTSAGTVPPAVEWQKTFRFGESAWRVMQTSDGGYAIAGGGYSKSVKRTGTLTKLDSGGNMQWNKNFTSIIPATWVLTSDDGYAAAGHTDEGFTLLVTDSNGDTLWNKTYSGGKLSAMVHTDDWGYAMASNVKKGYADVSPWTINDIMLTKTDSSGEIQWNRIYNFSSDNSFIYSVSSLIQTSDGGYALSGCASSQSTGKDYLLVKIDSAGNLQWTKTFGGLNDDEANSLIQTDDGGCVLAGNTYSFGVGGSDGWLVKTDSLGNLLWTRTYGGAGWLTELNGVPLSFKAGSDGSGDDIANCVIQTSDGGLAFTGQTGGLMWLVATDSSGKPLWNQTYSTYSIENRS